MKHEMRVLAVIFSVVLNCAFLAGYAVQRLGDQPRPLHENLNLTDEQRERFDAAQKQLARRIQETGRKMLALHSELIDVIASDDRDPGALDAKIAELRQGQGAMLRAVVDHLQTEKEILTPPQRARFFESLKTRTLAYGASGPRWLLGPGNRGGEQ
jgi:Spy/CpxP family protein refolding chaperone